MWRISIAIRRVVRSTLLRLAARLEEPDAAPPQPPDEEGIPADWLARVRRRAPQLLRKDAPSHAVVRRPFARRGDDADSPTPGAQLPRVSEDAPAAPRPVGDRSYESPEQSGDAAAAPPRVPRGDERAPTMPRLVPRGADEATATGPARKPSSTDFDASPEPRGRSRQPATEGVAGAPERSRHAAPDSVPTTPPRLTTPDRGDADAPARPSSHSFDSPAEHRAVSRLESESDGEPIARPRRSVASFQGSFQGPQRAQESAPASLPAPRQPTEAAPLHQEYQEQWQTADQSEWRVRYHPDYHDGYHHNYHRSSHVVVRDGESCTQEPRPSWPELPDAPLFGIPLMPIGTFDDAAHLARLSDEQRGSAWNE